MNYLLRRPKLGRTSVKEIVARSETGLAGVLHTKDAFPKESDIVFRWGCTATIPHKAALIVNKAGAIHTVTNKATFRQILSEKKLAAPCWLKLKDWAKEGVLPVVIRPETHHQGRNLFFCKTEKEVFEAIRNLEQTGKGFYISAFFKKTEEFRVFVVQGRVVCIAQKTPADANAIAWNVAQGGRFDNVRWGDWDLTACKMSIEAMALSDLDFGGVDIMKDAKGNYSVLEINSAPSLTSEYRQACFAKAFDYIVKNKSAKTIPIINRKPNWRNYIHPAISSEAT